MVIMTAKVSKSKLIAIALILVAVVLVLTILLSNSSKAATVEEPAAVSSSGVKTNDDRVAFLASFGWAVTPEPTETQEVKIPTDPSEVFLRYNELQQSQGYDLSQYAGKTVKRYVYTLTNYPDTTDTYYATVFVYKNDVIGGDIASARTDGIMHGFQLPT